MIFYFSATGNSQFAAEKLAEALGERLISIGVALRDEKFSYDVSEDRYIGFVVPTFAGTIPGAAATFIERLTLSGADGKHGFAVITAGGGTDGAPAAMKAALEEKGIPYSGSFDLAMIDNFIVWTPVPTGSALRNRLSASENRLAQIIDAVKNKESGTLPSTPPKDRFMPFTPVDSAVGSCKLYATDACDGCGVCAELCPMRCITMSAKKPVWKGQCTTCFACLHRCPAAAIQFGRETEGKARYTHPDTTVVTKNSY